MPLVNGHTDGFSRDRPIIDPFLCLLKEAVFSFGFYCKVSIAPVIMKVQNIPPSVYSIVPLARQ